MPPKAAPAKDAKADAKGGKSAGGKGGKGAKKESAAAKGPKKEVAVIPPGERRRARKARFVTQLRGFLAKYKNILVATVDFVGSSQMQQIRKAVRGKAVICMGKNTVIRKIVREEAVNNPKLNNLMPLIQGNVGFIFCNNDLSGIRTTLQANRVPAPAKTGVVAPEDVFVAPGPTGLDPGQTSFFQVLNIATKINKGAIEIVNRVHLIKKGEKCTASHVGLLAKLDIRPFSYGMIVTQAYENGAAYEAKILDIAPADILKAWFKGVARVAALSREAGYPTIAALPHIVCNAWRKLVALATEVNFNFPLLEQFKSSSAAAADEEEEEEAEEEEEEEEEEEAEEEDDGDIGGSMFD